MTTKKPPRKREADLLFPVPGGPPLANGLMTLALTADGRHYRIGRSDDAPTDSSVAQALGGARGRWDAARKEWMLPVATAERAARALEKLPRNSDAADDEASRVANMLRGRFPGILRQERSDHVCALVTERVLRALEGGRLPWVQPWVAGVKHQNGKSRTPYRGINQVIAASSAMARGFSSPFWYSEKQIEAAHGRLRRGQQHDATPIIFWLWSRDQSRDGEPQREIRTSSSRPFATVSWVYNLDQTDGIKPPKIDRKPLQHFKPLERAQAIAGRYQQGGGGPAILHGGDIACYSWRDDMVHIPEPGQFTSEARYYSTLFHELVHSTGHQTRLHRKSLTEMTRFGDQNYSMEELITEIATATLCAEAGIANETIENSVAYCRGWAKALQADAHLVVSASQKAVKAVDHVLGAEPPMGSRAVTAKKKKRRS